MTGGRDVAVAVIGGGATGAMLAYHLHRAGVRDVVVFEPRVNLGGGVAYSSSDPAHRINVPAAKMSIDTAVPSDFADWIDRDRLLARDPAAQSGAALYPARRVFGRYLAERLAPALQDGGVRHVRAKVEDLAPDNGGWVVGTNTGVTWRARYVVIANSHPPPALPAALRAVADDRRVIADPWVPDALDLVGADDRVAIVGTGLSMADVVASLDARRHRGPIFAFSRRGLRSRGHAKTALTPHGDFVSAPIRSARGLLRAVRRAVDASDQPWQAALDQVRGQGGAIWAALPVEEKRRLVRHLRPFWDVHRFRIAPQAEEAIARRLADGTLQCRAARLEAVRAGDDFLELVFASRAQGRFVRGFDRVINTTGPDHAGIINGNSYLGRLARAGMIEAHPSGLGLHVDRAHRVRVRGETVPGLLVAGPLARGAFGELMGLPEVTANAQAVAASLAPDILKRVISARQRSQF